MENRQTSAEIRKQRREANALTLASFSFRYVYVPTAKVFHRRDCKLILQAKEFFGSASYQTAAKHRRPCKCCNPQPEPASTTTGTPEGYVTARLINGSTVTISKNELIGRCRCKLHPGMLTERAFLQHQCESKGCRHFEKIATAPYWLQRTVLRTKERLAQENLTKEEKERKKREKKAVEAECRRLVELFQRYANEAGYAIKIMRLQMDSEQEWKLFYISEYSFGDAFLYEDLLRVIRQLCPGKRIKMRHIKDFEGNFVTMDMYYGKEWSMSEVRAHL